MPPTNDIQVAVELPPSINDRRLVIYKRSAILVKQGAFVQAHILTLVKNNTILGDGVGYGAKYALVLFTYLALGFCFGVMVSGSILTSSPTGNRTWVRDCVMWHWVIFVIAGTVTFIVQGLSYVWQEEPTSIAIAVSIITLLSALPLASQIPFHSF